MASKKLGRSSSTEMSSFYMLKPYKASYSSETVAKMIFKIQEKSTKRRTGVA